MDSNKPAALNNQSILSLIFGVLTVITFCMGWIPLPFTGLVCFPSSLLFGILALFFGTFSLYQIRRRGETGRPMAWTGIMVGGFVFLCVMCMIVLMLSFLYLSSGEFHAPPFLQGLQT